MTPIFKRFIPFALQTFALWMSLILLFIFSFEAIGKRALLCYLVLAVIIHLLGMVIRSRILRLVCISFGLVLFVCLSYIDIVHSLMFNDMLSASTIYIILETNSSESREFLAAGFDNRYIYVGIILLLSLLTSLIAVCRIETLFVWLSKKHFLRIPILWYLFFLCLLTLLFLSQTFLPLVVIRSVNQYHIEKKVLRDLSSDKLGGEFTNVVHSSNDADEVYVLIVGESTTRQRMGLYGYERNNNPRLSSIRNELIIYKDVISPHTHTLSSLGKVLTNASFEEDQCENTGTLIQLFNKAGFETYWLSNQCPIGAFESTITAISNSSRHQIFLNANKNSYDEVLLAPFQKLLQEDVKKKLIVIHLMGTHGSYEKRYPKAYESFHKQPKTQFKHMKAYTSINTYDNAVLYNDYIVSEIIEKLKACNLKSCALYLSDHGEEVYKDKNFAIHAEYDDTKSMYDIPFLMWCSAKMKLDTSHFVFDVDRKYSSEDLIYTMADIACIRYDEFDSKKSVVNPDFFEKERLITDKKNYDEEFSKSE